MNSWNEIEEQIKNVAHGICYGDLEPGTSELIRIFKETAHKEYLRGRREVVDLLGRIEKFQPVSKDGEMVAQMLEYSWKEIIRPQILEKLAALEEKGTTN